MELDDICSLILIQHIRELRGDDDESKKLRIVVQRSRHFETPAELTKLELFVRSQEWFKERITVLEDKYSDNGDAVDRASQYYSDYLESKFFCGRKGDSECPQMIFNTIEAAFMVNKSTK